MLQTMCITHYKLLLEIKEKTVCGKLNNCLWYNKFDIDSSKKFIHLTSCTEQISYAWTVSSQPHSLCHTGAIFKTNSPLALGTEGHSYFQFF